MGTTPSRTTGHNGSEETSKTTLNQPVRHERALRELIAAVHLPKALAMIKVPAHCSTNNQSYTPIGNTAADTAAKQKAGYEPPEEEANMLYYSSTDQYHCEAKTAEDATSLRFLEYCQIDLWTLVDDIRINKPPLDPKKILALTHCH